MKDLRCMSFTSKGTAEILVAGLQKMMLVVDLVKGEVVKQVCAPKTVVGELLLTGHRRYLRNASIPS